MEALYLEMQCVLQLTSRGWKMSSEWLGARVSDLRPALLRDVEITASFIPTWILTHNPGATYQNEAMCTSGQPQQNVKIG